MNTTSCRNAACLVLLIDQSASLGAAGNAAADVSQIIADTVNAVLSRLLENVPDPSLVDVGLVAYNTDELAAASVSPQGRSGLAGTPGFVPANQLDGLSQPPGKPVWIQPAARGGTPMCEALRECLTRLDDWTSRHPEGRAPVVLHLTDGHCRDGNPVPLAEQLHRLGTGQGNVVLINFRIAATGTTGSSTMFARTSDLPCADEERQVAAALFAMSSKLSDSETELAQAMGIATAGGASGLAYDISSDDLAPFIEFALQLLVEE